VKWESSTLGEVAEINPRLTATPKPSDLVTFVPMAAVSEQALAIIDGEERQFREVAKGYTQFQCGDIIIAKITPCFQNGKMALATNLKHQVGVGSTEFHVFRPRKGLDGAYLFHLLRAPVVRTKGVGRMKGAAGQRRVPAEYFAELPIPLPPLAEQKRIAGILDAADALRAKRREALAQLDTLLQATFLDLFGDPVTNPKGWDETKVGEICELVRGSSPRPKGDPRFYGGPVPRLMVADITRDGFWVTPQIDTLTTEGAKKSRPVPASTIVMAVSGDVGVVSEVQVPCCIHDGFVAFLDLKESIFRPLFLMYQFHLLKATHERRKAGAIFQNLTTTDIKAMRLPTPPVELQNRFMKLIEGNERQRSSQRKHLAELDTLFASLQSRAFRGEL
jgi:restriction endonuclease S subunit